MDFFEKLNELHANDVSPKKVKEVSGVSKEEVLQKVMDYVDKFDAKQKELENEEKGKVVKLRPAAKKSAVVVSYEPSIPAAAGRTYGYGHVGALARYSGGFVDRLRRKAGLTQKQTGRRVVLTGKGVEIVRVQMKELEAQGVDVSKLQAVLQKITGKTLARRMFGSRQDPRRGLVIDVNLLEDTGIDLNVLGLAKPQGLGFVDKRAGMRGAFGKGGKGRRPRGLGGKKI